MYKGIAFCLKKKKTLDFGSLNWNSETPQINAFILFQFCVFSLLKI